MLKSGIDNLVNLGIDKEEFIRDRDNIAVYSRYLSDSYTRYGWNYGMTFVGFQVIIPNENIDSEKIKYICNMYNNETIEQVKYLLYCLFKIITYKIHNYRLSPQK